MKVPTLNKHKKDDDHVASSDTDGKFVENSPEDSPSDIDEELEDKHCCKNATMEENDSYSVDSSESRRSCFCQTICKGDEKFGLLI